MLHVPSTPQPTSLVGQDAMQIYSKYVAGVMYIAMCLAVTMVHHHHVGTQLVVHNLLHTTRGIQIIPPIHRKTHWTSHLVLHRTPHVKMHWMSTDGLGALQLILMILYVLL